MLILQSAIYENRSVLGFLERITQIPGHQGSTIRFSDDFLVLYDFYKKFPYQFLQYLKTFDQNDSIEKQVYNISM